MQPHGLHIGGQGIGSGVRQGFRDATKKGDNDLCPSGGNVIDKTGNEESPGSIGLAFRAATSTATALWGSAMAKASKVCRGDSEVLRLQLRRVSEAGDAAVVVMQNDEVPSLSDLTPAGFGDDTQHRHCLERCQGDSTADIANYGSLTGHEAEYIDGIDATDDHRLHRRHDLQVCGEATAGEGLVALGQSVNYQKIVGPQNDAAGAVPKSGPACFPDVPDPSVTTKVPTFPSS